MSVRYVKVAINNFIVIQFWGDSGVRMVLSLIERRELTSFDGRDGAAHLKTLADSAPLLASFLEKEAGSGTISDDAADLSSSIFRAVASVYAGSKHTVGKGVQGKARPSHCVFPNWPRLFRYVSASIRVLDQHC